MAQKVMEEKQADKVAIILMNPQNGEIYAMVNWPEFNLNEPFELPEGDICFLGGRKAGTSESDVEKRVYQ